MRDSMNEQRNQTSSNASFESWTFGFIVALIVVSLVTLSLPAIFQAKEAVAYAAGSKSDQSQATGSATEKPTGSVATSADYRWVRALLGDLRSDDQAEDAIQYRLKKLPEADVSRLATQLALELRSNNGNANDRHYALDAMARWRRAGIPESANTILWSALEAELEPLTRAKSVGLTKESAGDVNRSPRTVDAKLWAQWGASSSQAGKLDSSRRKVLFSMMSDSKLSIVTRLSVLAAAMDSGVPADAGELDLLLKSDDPEIRLAALDWITLSPTNPKHLERFLKAARESKPKQLRERVYRRIASWDQPESAYHKSLKRALPKSCNTKDDSIVIKACEEALKKWSGGEK